jgi:hypothetical protein
MSFQGRVSCSSFSPGLGAVPGWLVHTQLHHEIVTLHAHGTKRLNFSTVFHDETCAICRYAHILDNNTNVTKVLIGPKTIARQDHEIKVTQITILATGVAPGKLKVLLRLSRFTVSKRTKP